MHPFDNDPFAMVWKAFHNLWPDAVCEVCWRGGLRDEEGMFVAGVTTFVPDEIPEVAINPSLEVWDAVEVLAHELAHVAVGIDEGHGDAWEKAFSAIHEEYERILHEEHPDDEYQTKESHGVKEE